MLIIDDSSYDRFRSKKVELLARIFDDSTGRLLKGFRMLTIGWSDGNSYLPLDFALLSSSDAKKRLDKRCCAYQRRKEATVKTTVTTVHLETMVKRILSTGVCAKYLLMDSWFTMPANIIALAQHIRIIGMVKKSFRIHYSFNGQSLDLMAIYRREAYLFFQFVSHRYERSSTIITSNKSFGDWQELFGDQVIATAILDRLLHHCKVINIKGHSYRLRKHQIEKNEVPKTE